MANPTAMQLSATELKNMTKWPDALIQEFLSLTQNQFGPAGFVIIPAAATTFNVKGPVNAESMIVATVAKDDATMKSVAVVAGAFSFDLIPNAAPTADTRVNYLIL
jgi:hypothetical protein